MRRILLLLSVGLAGCRGNEPPPSPGCISAESVAAGALMFGDAEYGMRGTTGGTLLSLGRDSAGWTAVVEPVFSDFPREEHKWPEDAETLSVRWTSQPARRATLLARGASMDRSGNPLGIGDSLTLALSCRAAVLLNWDHRRGVDTFHLTRRQSASGPI
jgi:hypothetical protein